RELHPPRQLAKVELWVLASPSRHLAERGRQPVEPALRLELSDGGGLAKSRANRLADVCGLEVQAPVDLAAHLADHAHVLELHDGAARAHDRQPAHAAITALGVAHRLASALADPGLDARAPR